MKRNFSLATEVVVVTEGVRYDLHNDYDFEQFFYDAVLNTFLLKWRHTKIEGNCFSIKFKDVLWIRIKGMESGVPFAENGCLDFMGYLHPDDDLIMDGFLQEDFSSDRHHLIFCFSAGLAVRIFAKETVASQENGRTSQ